MSAWKEVTDPEERSLILCRLYICEEKPMAWLTQSQLPPWAIAGRPVPARKERGCKLLGSGSSVALAFPLGPIGSRFLLKEL